MPAPKKRERRPPLNLTVDRDVKAAGRRVAYRRGKSLSELFTDFIKTLDREDRAARRRR